MQGANSPAQRAALAAILQAVPAARPATSGRATLELSLGAADPPSVTSAALVEDNTFRARKVSGEAAATVAAFLDGIQESAVVAWDGTQPLVFARIGAAVRARVARRMVTWGGGPKFQHLLLVPRPILLEDSALRVVPFELAPNEEHPMLAVRHAYRLVQTERERLERELAVEFASSGDGLLYVDGGLPMVEGDRLVGVIKSHHTLYVSGDALRLVLGLEEGERSSVFSVESRHRAPVWSWYLRLRDPRGRDPFWGLVRVEASTGTSDPTVTADELSRAILAERSPLALPDGRWDTMAYGIRDCEEYLRASLARVP